jgi:membrane-bound lytic murein transglycosylase A
VLYHDRAAIENGALTGKAPVIAWAADPIEFFFLQIQGSGRLRTPDGDVIRIGYAGQNGREYTGIGSVMRERGLLGEGPGKYPGSMQGIMAYIRDKPADGRELMRLNKSWIFFSESKGDGPMGAPVWLDLDRPEANGLWIAQDTGGAIKGVNRFDTFWGAGEDARRIAGGMSGRGRAYVLLPRAAAARLAGQKTKGGR